MIRPSVLDRAPAGARINVTPMIDVVMCLIVCYRRVGQLALNRAAGVRIPETADGGLATPTSGDPIVIAVLPDGALMLDGEPIAADRLSGELTGRTARRPDARIEIRADRDAPYGAVRPALDAARAAGIAELDLVTERGG